MRCRAAALNVRLCRGPPTFTEGAVDARPPAFPPPNRARISRIFSSIFFFSTSYPTSAIANIVVSDDALPLGMNSPSHTISYGLLSRVKINLSILCE